MTTLEFSEGIENLRKAWEHRAEASPKALQDSSMLFVELQAIHEASTESGFGLGTNNYNTYWRDWCS